jgi:exodeoxyribonuclease V alpha subunit
VSATAPTPPLLDEFDARRASRVGGLLRAFNEVGLLGPADVHVAARMARLVGEERESVHLAAALAVRAPRLGHVFVDLATIRDTASVESDEPVDLSTLPWPDVSTWLDEVRASDLVGSGESEGRGEPPLRLHGSELYLDRYWREERRVAADLTALAGGKPDDVDSASLADGVERLFPKDADDDERQRAAASAAISNRFAVIAGGPGTGKTTTVARIVALVAEQARVAGRRPPLVALAAPTGKAAARLQEAVHDEAARLPIDEPVRRLLLESRASTLHRLLGWRPGSHSRFKHDRENRLPYDVVIVDETSMVSLWLMARLVEAVRSDARLILVGDPGQLSSIEAGVVLADIVGPAAEGSAGSRDRAGRSAIGDGIVVLDRVYRFGGQIAILAAAIRRGDADAAVAALQTGAPSAVTWIAVDAEDPEASDALEPIRQHALTTGRAVIRAARAGAAHEALEALGWFRLLCAHRRGPHGVSTWTQRQQAWLLDEFADLELDRRDYVGRPLLVTENDYELGLYNGDTGVIVEHAGGTPMATFERAGELLNFSPLRLGAVETVYAMTIHKSQGSQFNTAAVLLPPADSPILTRELLYTAVTRARRHLVLIGTEATIRAAVTRPVSRASGLRRRLWPES